MNQFIIINYHLNRVVLLVPKSYSFEFICLRTLNLAR